MYFARGFLPIMYKDLLPRSFRLANAIGFGVGSMMLMAGGYLLILKMIAREDDPELELHQRLQDGDEEALNGKLLAMAEVRQSFLPCMNISQAKALSAPCIVIHASQGKLA